jgi:hypothetical protein
VPALHFLLLVLAIAASSYGGGSPPPARRPDPVAVAPEQEAEPRWVDTGASTPPCGPATATLVQVGLVPRESDPEAQQACAVASAESGIPCAPFVVVMAWQQTPCTDDVDEGVESAR